MSYQINIAIDSEGLEKIYSVGQTVTLAKKVIGQVQTLRIDDDAPGTAVAWIAFSPLQKNEIVYDDNYYFFATTTPLSFGNVISMSAQTPNVVQMGWLYTFAQGSFAASSGLGNTYNVANATTSNTAPVSFGLAQSAQVNNVPVLAPLDAMYVLYNQTGYFQPLGSVWIFLSSSTNNGTILSGVSSQALEVKPTREKPTVNVGFNDATNTFYLIG